MAAAGARRSSGARRTLRAGTAVAFGAGWAVLLAAAITVSPAALAVVVAPVALVAAVSAAGAVGRRHLPAARVAVAAGAPLVAAGSLVVARLQGASLALALVGACLAFDAGAFVIGNGRSALGGPPGVAAGVASVAVVALFVAAIMNPPFSGSRPWVVFGLVAVLAPAGVKLCERAVGGAALPALRRLDSLVLAGPAWVAALAAVAHR
jgi:hypothetical protein